MRAIRQLSAATWLLALGCASASSVEASDAQSADDTPPSSAAPSLTSLRTAAKTCNTVHTCSALLGVISWRSRDCANHQENADCRGVEDDIARLIVVLRKLDYDSYTNERAATEQLGLTPKEIDRLKKCDLQEWRNHDYFSNRESWIDRATCWRYLADIELEAFARAHSACSDTAECAFVRLSHCFRVLSTNKRWQKETEAKKVELDAKAQAAGFGDSKDKCAVSRALQPACVAGQCVAE